MGLTPRQEIGLESATLLVTAALQMLLPDRLSAGPRWMFVSIVAALAIASALTSRKLHLVLVHASLAVVTGAVIYSLAELIQSLFAHRGTPAEVLASAVVIWSSNLLVFAVWYYRLDAGGPHARWNRDSHDAGAFLFPQMTMSAGERKSHGLTNWHPRFVDYLFLAFNTSTAFSPTDVPVLSPWAKVLMMVQSSIALASIAVLAARAINIL